MRYFLVSILVVSFLATGIWQSQAGQKSETAAARHGDDTVKHGEYLVNRLVLCGDCHTPVDARGKPDTSKLLQGASLTFKPKEKTEDWVDHSPDITSSGLGGEWTETQLVKFLMTGIDPEGKKAAAPMPAFRLQENDARAIARYLKSLPGKKKTNR